MHRLRRNHCSPTILTDCAEGLLPIFGGKISVVVFLFQKSTIIAASFSGLSWMETRVNKTNIRTASRKRSTILVPHGDSARHQAVLPAEIYLAYARLMR